MHVRGAALYMQQVRTRMRFLVWLALFVAVCAGLEMDVRANKDGKLSYKQYLAKVKNFFNVTQ